MNAPRLNLAVPSMAVTGLEEALRFYREQLGFAEVFRNGDFFAIVRRDGVEIGLCPADCHAGMPGRSSVYLKVTGISTLYQEIATRDVEVVRELRREEYNMCEFTIRDHCGNTLHFGEEC